MKENCVARFCRYLLFMFTSTFVAVAVVVFISTVLHIKLSFPLSTIFVLTTYVYFEILFLFMIFYPLPRPQNPVILRHQCQKRAVLGPLLAPKPNVAHALANCLTDQPLKTTLGLCCFPAGYQYGTVICFKYVLSCWIIMSFLYENYITVYCRKYVLRPMS